MLWQWVTHKHTHTSCWLHKYILCTCDFKRVWTDAGHCDVSLTTECGIRLRLLCTTCTVYIQCPSVMLLHTCLLMNINTFFFRNTTDFWVHIQLKFLRTKSSDMIKTYNSHRKSVLENFPTLSWSHKFIYKFFMQLKAIAIHRKNTPILE